MNKPTIKINGETFPLATNLMIAYKIQSMNEHRPYSQVFKDVADMGVEKQIDIVFASFASANPKHIWANDNEAFRNYFLENMNLKDLMGLLKNIVNAIMGNDIDEDDAEVKPEASAKN